MDNLVRQTLADTLPPLHAAHTSVCVLDVPAMYYVPCDQPPNTVREDGDAITLWLAPDRAVQVGGVAPDGFVSGITDGIAVFEIAGVQAEDILAMGCTLDRALLIPGHCAQTLFGGVRVLLYRHGDAIRLHAERHFAAFLYRWFEATLTALR